MAQQNIPKGSEVGDRGSRILPLWGGGYSRSVGGPSLGMEGHGGQDTFYHS